MSKIKDIVVREILNSKGSIDVVLESGVIGSSDIDFLSNIDDVNTIKKEIIGIEVFDQESIDNKLFSFNEFDKNLIKGISFAVIHAASLEQGIPLFKYISDSKYLPKLIFEIPKIESDINYLIIPKSYSIEEEIKIGNDILNHFKNIELNNIDLIISTINNLGYKVGEDIFLGIESNLLYDGKYQIGDNNLSSEELISYYKELCNKYPIILIENPVSKSDLEGFKLITEKLGSKNELVCRDNDFSNCIKNECCNSVLISDVSTIMEVLNICEMASKNNYKTIISTTFSTDTGICDLAVALNSDIKINSLNNINMISNRLMEIEENINL